MNALLKMAAKSCREDNSKWLSFVTHSFDTAAVMDRLFLLWISQHDREYIARQLKKDTNLDESINTAQRVCRLVALLHDIGKLSNEFQCKIT
ncbi:MAG: hypothetical protein IJU04_01165, partial [Ruminococcus sp.]|nr:hypothetical protein [Ruminococcus sp.]